MTDKPRMEAYYYSFNSTNVPVVDKVLSAVACAGKAFHHTSDWYEECDWPGHTGTTPVDWIQNAADEAAREIERLRQALLTIEAACRDHASRGSIAISARIALGEDSQ